MTEPSLADLHGAFGEWLAFPELDGVPSYDLVDVALAAVVGNRLHGDPLWLFLVAPPSSGKTEVLRALGDAPDVFPLSSLTAQTFASGFERKGAETSLLPKLSGKIVVMKDFGTVLTLHREARAEIFAQLREIYDGQFAKAWGNGKAFEWSGKVGLLAGVTGALDREYSMNGILGERFLLFRVKGVPGYELARRALDQTATLERERRQRLRALVAAFLYACPETPPPLPAPFVDGIIALSTLTATARSPVLYDPRTSAIELIPEPEAPGRVAKALATVGRALAIVRAEPAVSVRTYATVAQIAQDSIPATRRIVLEAALSAPGSTTAELGERTGYPTTTARRYLQELVAVRLLDRSSTGPGHPDRWAPSDRLREMLRDARRPLGDLDPHTPLTRSVGGE